METLYLKRNQHCSTKKTPFSLGTIDGKLHLIFICRHVVVPILLVILVISSYLWLLSHTCLLQISLLNYSVRKLIVLWIDFFQMHSFIRMLQSFSFHHNLYASVIVTVAFYWLWKGWSVVLSLGYVGRVKVKLLGLSCQQVIYQDSSGIVYLYFLKSINK